MKLEADFIRCLGDEEIFDRQYWSKRNNAEHMIQLLEFATCQFCMMYCKAGNECVCSKIDFMKLRNFIRKIAIDSSNLPSQ